MWRPDLYLMLVAVAFGFGAVLAGVSGQPSLVWIPLGIVAAVLVLASAVAMVYYRSLVPEVALVGEPRGHRLFALRHTLDEAGFAIRTCRGAQRRDCPVLRGERCDIGGDPALVVIDDRRGGLAAVAPCGRALSAPVVVLEKGQTPGSGIDDSIAWLGQETTVADQALAVLRRL